MLGPYPADERYTRGGVEKVMFNVCEGLRTRGDIDLHVVTLNRQVRRDETAIRNGMTIHFLAPQQRLCLPTFHAWNILKARRVIKHLAPDLVHCQESGLEAFIASGLRMPSVVTVHANFRNERRFYPGIQARLRFQQTLLLASMAERSITCYVPSSEYVRREMGHLAAKFADVVENPIEQRYFKIPDLQVPGRILFSGTMYPRKGVHDLVEAVALLRRQGVACSLHLTGQVHSPEYLDQVQKIVRDNGLQETVKFCGLVSEADLEREIGEASVAVLPSYAETSPMAVQQAMASGKAIVATRVGGIPHLVVDEVSALLLEPGDVPGLAERLARVLRDEPLRKRLSAVARQEAEMRFSTSEVAARMVALWRQVLTTACPLRA